MKEAPLPSNERERLEELHRYEVLDTSADGDIDDLTLLAAHICHAPIALVSLVDATRQWFKSKVGIDVTETPRAVAFCAHTILGKDVLIVPDALADDRFADNPLVTGEPEIRFYAGAPLVTSNGYQLGTLCVIDRRARNVLPEEKEALQVLSQQVVHRLEYRRQLKELQRMTRAHQQSEEALLSLNADLEVRVRARTAELERAYQQLNFHLENTPLGVIQWAPDFQLLQWSPQTERIFGWTSQEVVGKYPREWPFISEEDRPAMQKIMERLMNGQERRKVHRVRHYAKNGQEVHCVWHTSVMVGESGRVVSMMALVQDLSEQVKLERQFHQAQKMEAVGRLAGGIAHDFNNLLTVINGFSDLVVTDRETPDAIKKAVEQILYAGQQAAGLTRQLLAFSRQQVLHPQTLSLNEAVLKIDKMLRRLIGEDVRLVLDLDAHPDTIRVDPGQVEQIVMNLAVNARDAMPNGGQLCIDTATVRLEEPLVTQMAGILLPGTYVSLVLRDTGAGIDEPTLARIFEPFFTTKGPGKGTGLGLATVLGVVQQSRGAITVSSCVGKGTTVQMYFPCVAEMESLTNVSSPAAGVKRGTETILLVEDEPTVRSFVHEVLSAFGYTVLEVTTAEEAMFVSNGYEQPIQLLVTDVVLPQGRGTALAKEMCRTRPGIKILLMSGYIDQSLTADNEMTAQLPFLEKPFTREVLLAKVREALES